jgi:hypothetical protein
MKIVRLTLLCWGALAGQATPVSAALPLPAKLSVKTETHQTVAETQAAAKRQGTVNAAGANWQCSGNRCTTSAASAIVTVAACKALAHEVGPLKSYGSSTTRLGGAELDQCNAGAGKPVQPGLGSAAPLAVRPASPASVQPAPASAIPPSPRDAKPSPAQPRGFASAAKLPAMSMNGPMPANQSANKQGGFAPAAKSAEDKSSAPKASGFAPKPSDKGAAPRPSGPIAFTIEPFAVTGTGALAVPRPFSPVSFSTEPFTVTGTGGLAAALPFAPKSFTTDMFTVTGTGALH